MSLYPNDVPGVPGAGVQGEDDYFAAPLDSTGGGDFSGFFDDGGGMMGGMDLDVSMGMDLGFVPDAQNYNSLQQPAQRSGHAETQGQGQDRMTGNMNNGGVAYSQSQQQDSNVAGAGPLPTGFGMPAPSTSSTLTEFTKRRNWSQRIIEEIKDFLHILTPDGRILYVSPSCKTLTGYEPQTLIGKFIGEYVHPDDSGIFMREFNESIASGNALRFFYRFKKEDGTYMIFECDGHPHISSEPATVATLNATPNPGMPPISGLCRGFFMMARPYPTRNAALLDSFLEHKIENERLMKRIRELKHDEEVENAEQDRLFREQASPNVNSKSPVEGQPGGTKESTPGEAEQPGATPNYQGMPPPAKPTISNTQLTRQNLDSALSAQKPDSMADKMSRYEANSTHLESIELMTGLRYRDGERSHGISTGDTSPALIRGDAGIAILLDRDRDGPKKDRKKLKVADEYVCSDCGTLDSPEWRKGPKGPKTLCNACGLRWAKKEKKRNPEDGGGDSPLVGVSGQQGGGNTPGMGMTGQ